MPHQTKALNYCRATSYPALFMEMRLGKTKVVIEWLRSMQKRILVVCPLSTVRGWEDELRLEHEPSPALLLGNRDTRLNEFAKQVKWNLINFEGIMRYPELLSNYHWGAIVVDESTRIKNPKSQASKLLCQYAHNADCRCIMSGNPDPEGPLDLFQQFKFLIGNMMGFHNYYSYRSALFFSLYKHFKWVTKPSIKPRIRSWVDHHSFVMSRKEVGLANKKIYETRTVNMESEQCRLMEKLESEFALETSTGELQTQWVTVKLIWMARLAGGYVDGKRWFTGKFMELLNLLQGELKKEQVVVWFRFNAELDYAITLLSTHGINCSKIDGTLDEQTRARIRRDFSQGHIRCLLVQQKVGMFGLDLSTASTAIYFSNNYSSEIRIQSEDRIEHPLKKEPLLIMDICTAKTVDEDVVKILKRKKKESAYYLMHDELTSTIQERHHARLTSN